MQVPTYTWVVLILGIQKLCEIHTQVLTQPVSKLVVCTKPTREKSQMMGKHQLRGHRPRTAVHDVPPVADHVNDTLKPFGTIWAQALDLNAKALSQRSSRPRNAMQVHMQGNASRTLLCESWRLHGYFAGGVKNG